MRKRWFSYHPYFRMTLAFPKGCMRSWSCLAPMIMLVFMKVPNLTGQTISYDVSSTPVDVDFGGKAELMGEVALSRSSLGAPLQTTQAGYIRFVYQGVPIANSFEGSLGVDLGTGLISHPKGITLYMSGGFVHSGVTAQVINEASVSSEGSKTSTAFTTGSVILSLPAGLTIAPGDQIRVNGVRADVRGLPVNRDIAVNLQSNPSNGHSFINVSTVRVARVAYLTPVILTNSPLPEAVLSQDYDRKIEVAGGSPPHTWEVIKGEFPAGFSLNKTTGNLHGFPVKGGHYTFTIKVTDAVLHSVSEEFTLDVQGINLSAFALDFGQIPPALSTTRNVKITNAGTRSVAVTANVTGSPLFRVSPAAISLAAGESRQADIVFSPDVASTGLLAKATVEFTMPGLTRRIQVSGRTETPRTTDLRIMPNFGSTLGNSRVRISGLRFQPGAQVWLGGVLLTNKSIVEGTDLIGTTGAHSAGRVDLLVYQPDGSYLISPSKFTYREFDKVAPSSQALRIPFVADTSQYRSNLGVTNLRSDNAAVTVTLVDSNGFNIASKTLTVPGQGFRQINGVIPFLLDSGSTTGVEGYLLVESDQLVRCWISQIDNTTQDPSLISGTESTMSQTVVPSSVLSERYSTSLVVANANPEELIFSIRVRSSAGLIQGELNQLVLPGYGYLSFENLYQAVGLTQGVGPIEIQAEGGGRLLASARISSRQGTGGYFAGVDPAVTDKNPLLPYVVDTEEFRTNLGINNPGSVSASVQVDLMDESGEVLGSAKATVPPKGLVQMNNVIRTIIGTAGVSGKQGWLRLSADEPILAWVSQIENSIQDPNFLEGRSIYTNRGTSVDIPVVTRVGHFKSTLALVNQYNSPTKVQMILRNMDGVQIVVSEEELPAYGARFYPDILGSLGVAAGVGILQIDSFSGSPLLTASRVYSDNGTGDYLQTETTGP